jgi:hypothetical protein
MAGRGTIAPVKRTTQINFRVTDKSDQWISSTAGELIPKATLASAVLDAAIDAIVRSKKPFTLPLRFEVKEEVK